MLRTVEGIETVELLLRSLYYDRATQGRPDHKVDDYTIALRELVGKVRAARYWNSLRDKSISAVWTLLDRGQKESTPADWKNLSEQIAQERRLAKAAEKLNKLCLELLGEIDPE